MAKKKKSLSQAQIWDDSALLQSWDEALEEYKVSYPLLVSERISLNEIASSITAFMQEANVSKM